MSRARAPMLYVPSSTSPVAGPAAPDGPGVPRSHVKSHSAPPPLSVPVPAGVAGTNHATLAACRLVVTRKCAEVSVMMGFPKPSGDSPVTRGAPERPGYGRLVD